jgi:hypothetical protein
VFKSIFLSFVFIFTAPAQAKFIGGILKNNAGIKLGLECVEKFESGRCSLLHVLSNESEVSEFRIINKIDLRYADIATRIQEAGSNARQDLNSTYGTAAMVSTLWGIHTYFTVSRAAFPLVVVGVAADIIKAPVIGVAFITHKLTDKLTQRRFNKSVHFMLDPLKHGKKRMLRKRYFRNLLKALIQD